MADVTVAVQLVPDLGLPYTPGAESALGPDDADAFVAISDLMGVALTLIPSFKLPVEELGDLMAAARQGGIEPPDLFSFFGVTCPEDVAEDVQAALETLPFVLRAGAILATELPAWTVAADPLTRAQFHLRRAPTGVDAFATWVLPGGGGLGIRAADVEGAWDLTHPDLIGVERLAPFSTADASAVDHGTFCVGLLGGASNSAFTTGVAPTAQVAVSTLTDPGTPEAILRAARHVGRGGVVLIEAAVSRTLAGRTPDAPIEHNIPEWAAIRTATSLGVLVVEPAGNGSVDLDTDPLFSHISNPALDSGALMVAAGENITNGPAWTISLFSTRGARIDCFGPGERILAPSSNPANADRVDRFDGTSPASAIIAGVAVTVQGLALQATGQRLTAAELHARLRDRTNGTAPTPPTTPIGIMPDLATLAAGLGLRRIPPVSALVTGPGQVVFVRADPQNVDDLQFLSFDEALGLSTLRAVATPEPPARTNGHVIALSSANDGIQTFLDAVTPSEFGTVCHRPLDLDGEDPKSPVWAQLTGVDDPRFLISTPMSATVAAGRVIVAGLDPSGAVLGVAAERAPLSHNLVPSSSTTINPPTGQEPEITSVDPGIHFDATPVLIRQASGNLATLIGVDRAGRLRHGSWSLPRRWSNLDLIDTGLDPREPPAIVADGPALHVLGVDETTRELRTSVRASPASSFSALRTIATPALVTFGIPIEIVGGVVAASDGAGMLMALALDAVGRPLFTVRAPGLDWSPLLFVPAVVRFVARGGLAVASPASGVFMAVGADESGALHIARFNQVAWTPFAPG